VETVELWNITTRTSDLFAKVSVRSLLLEMVETAEETTEIPSWWILHLN